MSGNDIKLAMAAVHILRNDLHALGLKPLAHKLLSGLAFCLFIGMGAQEWVWHFLTPCCHRRWPCHAQSVRAIGHAQYVAGSGLGYRLILANGCDVRSSSRLNAVPLGRHPYPRRRCAHNGHVAWAILVESLLIARGWVVLAKECP